MGVPPKTPVLKPLWCYEVTQLWAHPLQWMNSLRSFLLNGLWGSKAWLEEEGHCGVWLPRVYPVLGPFLSDAYCSWVPWITGFALSCSLALCQAQWSQMTSDYKSWTRAQGRTNSAFSTFISGILLWGGWKVSPLPPAGAPPLGSCSLLATSCSAFSLCVLCVYLGCMWQECVVSILCIDSVFAHRIGCQWPASVLIGLLETACIACFLFPDGFFLH